MPKILVVDDNQDLVSLLEYELKRRGYAVICAADGRQAVEKAKAELPDLILMDITMPIMDGTEAGAMLKQDPQTSGIPVIYLTALVSEQDQVETNASKYNLILPKSVKFPELFEKIRKAIESKT